MRAPLASTKFVTGPADDVAVKDVYSVDGKSTITTVKEILTETASGVSDALRNTPGLVSSVASTVAGIKTGRLTNVDAIMRIGQVLGGQGGILDKLTGPVRERVLAMVGMDSEQVGRIYTEVQGAVRYGEMGDITRMGDALDMFRMVTGSDEIINMFDLGAEVALLSGIVTEAVSLGIPEAIDIMMEEAPDDWSRTQIAYNTFPTVVWSGDIYGLDRVVEYMQPEVIAERYPNYIRDFLSRYRVPVGSTAEQYPTFKNNMIATFLKINPYWDKALRGSVYIDSLIPFISMSDDARTVFMSTNSHQPAVMLAKDMQSVELATWVKSNFPFFPESI